MYVSLKILSIPFVLFLFLFLKTRWIEIVNSNDLFLSLKTSTFEILSPPLD